MLSKIFVFTIKQVNEEPGMVWQSKTEFTIVQVLQPGRSGTF